MYYHLLPPRSYRYKASANILTCVDYRLSLISRMERLRSFKLFLRVDDQLNFATGIGLATNVLDSLACPDALTIELSYTMLHLIADTRDYNSKAGTYQLFEESAIRLNPSRVLFVVACVGRERTVLWTRTLQRIFPALHKQCPLTVQCQGERSSISLRPHAD